jgi:hypothetical protein
MATANIVDMTTPAGLVPAHSQVPTANSYLNFADGSADWTQQYLPELYESEVERYGNRSISSFLRLVGAEMPMSSDQVIWSEQGRLHITMTGAVLSAAGNTVNTLSSSGVLRNGQTVIIKLAGGEIINCHVSDATGTTATLKPYEAATLAAAGAADTETFTLFVYGSEFAKGSSGMSQAIQPEFHTFSNKPIIIKDYFEVSGSDTAQIGWVEVSGEAGQSGYLWYMKAEGDTRTRFEDYLEMSVVEGVLNNSGAAPVDGTEGLFAAIESRGIVSDGFGATWSYTASTASLFQQSLDNMCIELDKQGAIEENMLFLNRAASLGIDNGLSLLNGGYDKGTSYGVFENSEDMALNLGFSGFRRGSYDFYKTDWKYLNDQGARGYIGGVEGVLVPAGTSSVYDQMMGKNVRRPFLHVRYRASEMDNRRMKSWVIGSVGASNSSIDAMQIHYLSERCLVTQAANNFILFNSADAVPAP